MQISLWLDLVVTGDGDQSCAMLSSSTGCKLRRSNPGNQFSVPRHLVQPQKNSLEIYTVKQLAQVFGSRKTTRMVRYRRKGEEHGQMASGLIYALLKVLNVARTTRHQRCYEADRNVHREINNPIMIWERDPKRDFITSSHSLTHVY